MNVSLGMRRRHRSLCIHSPLPTAVYPRFGFQAFRIKVIYQKHLIANRRCFILNDSEWLLELLVDFTAGAGKVSSPGHVVLASCKARRHTHTHSTPIGVDWGWGGREMSAGIEVIAFQRDKHTFHTAPHCVIIYCPIGHVLPPLNVFIFIIIFFIYFL